jgi:carbonic anhydrase/acetyltransferase-like protein (isoleucine patch superfamily)
VLEAMVEAGADDIEVIIPEPSVALRDLLGNGGRWGVTLRYHQAVSSAISELAQRAREEAVLVAHADCLPQIDPAAIARHRAPLFFCWDENGRTCWTGWGIMPLADLANAEVGLHEIFERYCFGTNFDRTVVHPPVRKVMRPLLADSHQELIDAHLRALGGDHQNLLLTGRELAPGVRIARNVTVHETAKLSAPVFIGENSRIGENCHIGPGAFIGKDSIIEARTAVENSVICPGTYVGEGLDLRHVYVDGGQLVNTRLRAEVESVDELLLTSVYGKQHSVAQRVLSWIRS